MTAMLGEARLDRIEESSDIGNVPNLDLPGATSEAPAPCLGWLERPAIDPRIAAATRRRILKGGMAVGEEHHR